MERIRSGARGYVPLDVIHRENLDEMLRKQDLSDVFTLAEKDALSHAWEKLDPWPDVVAGLSALRTKGYLIAPCSNGSIALMSRLARHADFAWDAIVGAEVAQDYKPKAEVYLASARALGFAPGDVMMAAAHNNDLEAARDAGLQTGFFPRLSEHGPGQTTDLTAEQDWDIVAEDVIDLAERLPALSGL
jgi:2-haloacid dehalogenase